MIFYLIIECITKKFKCLNGNPQKRREKQNFYKLSIYRRYDETNNNNLIIFKK